MHDLLGAQPKVAYAWALALRAGIEYLTLPVTVVTQEDAFSRVIRQRYIATVTHSDKATVAAQHTTGRAAPIEKKDGLLSHTQNLLKLTVQAATDNAGIAGM
jgi:hypothetical protein